MERCPKCGNKLSNIDVLCPRCGAFVEVIQVKSSFITPVSSETQLPKVERPNLIVYNEDFPGEGLFPEIEEEEVLLSSNSEPDDLADHTAFSLPDLSDITLPEFEAEAKPAAANEPTESQAEPQADSRVARRARERQWLELEEMNASASTPEAQLLKEADELTSRSAARSRANADTGRKTVLKPLPDSTEYSAAEKSFGSSDVSDEPRRYRSQQKQAVAASGSIGLKKLPAPAAILLWAMLAAAIFLGFFFLNRFVQTTYGGYPGFIREITNGKIELDTNAALADSINVTTAEAKTDSGAPAHTFSVSAARGTSVRIMQTGDVFPMEDGKAVFTITDESIALALGAVTYDNTIKAENLNLEITFGTSTQKHVVPPFDLHLIRSEYARQSPSEALSTVTSDVVALSLTVAPGATVFINNVNYTDRVSDDGMLSIDLELESAGDNIFAVDVIQPGRQAVKDNFTVTREAEQTVLIAEAEYQRVYSESFECRGTTQAGATLSAELGGKTFAGLVSDSGAFSVACTVSEFGLYTVKLAAASMNMANNEIEVTVEYLPEFSAFASKAQKKTVPDAVNNATKLINTNIKITAKPESLRTEELAQLFSLKSGSSELKCYYYGGAPKLTDGNTYTFYGNLDETGQFYVMFVE